jgi:hypothetical protein
MMRAERIIASYNQRGTAEHYVKEGKNAIKWTGLSCRTFVANAVRLPAPRAGVQPRQFRAHLGHAQGGRARGR